MPLVGGTDKMSSDVPVGLYRTYVHIPPDEEFSYASWCRNLARGRTFHSGGPLLDTGGNVIGVVVAKIDSVAMYKTTGDVVRDIGLVLPGDRAQRFLEAQSVRYRLDQRRPLQSEDRLLQDTRPFMVQVGCWK